MEKRKKIALLEEMMELDEGTLSENMNLNEIEGFDSMARLSLIVLMKDECGKKITTKQIRSFQTVKDILDYMD